MRAAGAITTTQDESSTASDADEPTEITINGKKFVNAAVCRAGPKCKRVGAKTYEGEVNGKPVTLIRDTGCDTILINTKFVDPKDFTGETLYLKMADASVKEAKSALITIKSPFYNGIFKAAVMDTTIHDLLIGDVEGARPPG